MSTTSSKNESSTMLIFSFLTPMHVHNKIMQKTNGRYNKFIGENQYTGMTNNNRPKPKVAKRKRMIDIRLNTLRQTDGLSSHSILLIRDVITLLFPNFALKVIPFFFNRTPEIKNSNKILARPYSMYTMNGKWYMGGSSGIGTISVIIIIHAVMIFMVSINRTIKVVLFRINSDNARLFYKITLGFKKVYHD